MGQEIKASKEELPILEQHESVFDRPTQDSSISVEERSRAIEEMRRIKKPPFNGGNTLPIEDLLQTA